MRKINYIVMLTALILSTSYILGIELYDRGSYRYKDLFECIQIGNIQYKEIGIEVDAVKDKECLSSKEVYNRLDEVVVELSHEEECSKLCTKLHRNQAVNHIEIGKNKVVGTVAEEQDSASYNFSLTSKELEGSSVSYYKMKLSSKDMNSNIQKLYDRTTKLFDTWQVDKKETFYAKGIITGELTEEQRKAYKIDIFEALNAKDTNYYKDDYSGNTEVYYGFTRKVKDSIKEANGEKTNLQVSFSYNEINQTTEIIIAAPFYNEPF